MKPVPYCVPEIIDTVFHAAGLVSEDRFIHQKVLEKVLVCLSASNDEENPAELALKCLRVAYKSLGVRDPFEKEKARLNRSMCKLDDKLGKLLGASEDALATALRLSLAASGDSIRGLGRDELELRLNEQLAVQPALDESEKLLVAAAKADKILFICDSAGEIAVDRMFVEILAKKASVTVAVSAKPVLTRATAEDASATGYDSIEGVEVIDPGADMLGLVLERASAGFRQAFMEYDLVIAKGEMNYQTLACCGRDLFFVLRAQCPTVAGYLEVPAGSAVVKLAQFKK